MNLEEIEITINKNGQVEVHERGVQGKKCLELTRELEQALGGEIILRQMTAEALEEPETKIDQDQNLKAGH